MKKREILSLLAILILGFSIHSEGILLTTKVAANQLPKNITYSGKLIEARNWKDSQGEHLLLLTETGVVPSPKGMDESARDAELFAFHYLGTKGSFQQTWKIYDFIKDCPVDLEANFLKDEFIVTDLNKDQISEVWLTYVTSCRGDVSPSTMKVIMYESGKKFAMRGRTRVKVSETDWDGGDFIFDKAFGDGPASFRNFGADLWHKLTSESPK
ncbi:M949_RS01915 family surface polysaccharide biosynthesis protein [Leptospira ilyithenensis]|uniref:Uncharacterized protein n=1 Tax=Leptospira ilyithenensis TaxID=2484901 RepID=A0A4R9LPW9_9LEPT|nr:hypothetical protein [Leptospira ilyithenensis]TGN11061.1 hypothetical protein EHS11_07830 [Leptospira ilyithenensis]